MMFPSFDKLSDANFEQNCRMLAEAGITKDADAVTQLMRLRRFSSADFRNDEASENIDPSWYQTVCRILAEAPMPAEFLDTVCRFVRKWPQPKTAYSLFEETPRSLEVLARLACGSPFLTETLLSQPDALRQLTTERRTAAMKSREEFVEEATEAIHSEPSTRKKLASLRRYQRREILRIGMCDAFGLLDLKFVTLQISLLADAMVQTCLGIACQEYDVSDPPFTVLALGKHGGEELNYSSDIDLILVAESDASISQKIARRLIDGLSEKMSTGFLYRVDMRLRPWGDAGPLVSTVASYDQYLRNDAELWEKQALLKARVIAGNRQTGERLLSLFLPRLADVSRADVLTSVRSMKEEIEHKLRQRNKLSSEVKLGAGSIRDVEFLVQALQLMHCGREPRLITANTLDALVKLTDFGFLDAAAYRQLREGYVFLRTIEHALQLLHNQQTHELPESSEQREWLSRRMDFPGEQELLNRFHEHRAAVRRNFTAVFMNAEADADVTAPDSHPNHTTDNDSRLDQILQRDPEHYQRQLNRMMAELQADERDGVCDCRVVDVGQLKVMTIAAGENPELMAVICGLLFTRGLDIREAHIAVGSSDSRFGHHVPKGHFLGHFLCEVTSTPDGQTEHLDSTGLAAEIVSLLQTGRDKSRETLLGLFCERMRRRASGTHTGPDYDTHPRLERSAEAFPTGSSHQPAGHPAMKVEVERGTEDAAVLKISAVHNDGFLFELANALAVCDFRIVRADVGEKNAIIDDTFYVTEADGKAVVGSERIEELRTVVTLIKQFTDWLPSNSDPHRALLRFRKLLHKLVRQPDWESELMALSQPRVLRSTGRVLGLSRHLWEDFLQVRTEKLLPLLTNIEQLHNRSSREELSTELSAIVDRSSGVEEVARALNQFKDHHLFRIDLRHLLGDSGAFGEFSTEVTDLAEVVVEAAAEFAVKELTTSHGAPRLPDGTTCPFTIIALGKFGGVEMGFASDIELFLVFAEDCHTEGPQTLTSAAFFERVVQQVSQLIQSRHKGIFEIDLRMRPYGQAGSPAISLTNLKRYFSAEGDAWPYERQALVKSRCVTGCEDFQKQVAQECHAMTYRHAAFDFDAMRALREKQIRQLVRGGTMNAKLSEGGLVDCEYAVQALQLTFGDRLPELRTPNTMQALDAACSAGVLSRAEYGSATHAYVFLRQLIDCLRMVRGNAQDLTVPPAESVDFRQLSRRMEVVYESELLPPTLEAHLAAVKRFAARVEQICMNADTTS